MKNLKLKFAFFSLLAAMTLTVFMTSCEQETITSAIDEIEMPTDEHLEHLNTIPDLGSIPSDSPIPERTAENTSNMEITDRSTCLQGGYWYNSAQIGCIFVGSVTCNWVWSAKYKSYIYIYNSTDICHDGLTFYTYQAICGKTGKFWDNDANDPKLWYSENGVWQQLPDCPAQSDPNGIVWKDKIGVNQFANRLSRNRSTDWDCHSGAASVNTIPNGQNGWIEVNAAENWGTKFFGLSNNNPNACRSTISHSVYFDGSKLSIYEGDVYVGHFENFIARDIIRVERIGSTIYYKKNGVTFYTSQKPSYGSLIADVSIKTLLGTIGDSKCSHPAG